ncbi:MAG TPA: FHA domain-containing protein [Pyrinomonadaceae bacterium]|nr:FHA domain-containing protein [Pyrinomonadaceae bacterium]
MPQENKYIIIREDLVQDPVTIITDGLLIGRLQECELLLNHPAVSRAQAGIKLINDTYFLFGLRPSNPVKINGKAVEENEALAPGDLLEAGPFLLETDLTEDALVLKVSLQIGTVVDTSNLSSPNLGTAKLEAPDTGEKKAHAKTRAAPLPGDKALDIFWDKRIREAGKMVRPSPLFPKGQRRAGKAAFNWRSTTDLRSHWPVSFFVWGAVIVTFLSVAAAYLYASVYSPAPVASVHSRSNLSVFPPIAAKANANSCTSCHSLTGSMEKNCAQCHTAEAFVATVIEPHVAAGIGCIACHAEHRGAEFRAATAALSTCTECHNDANQNSYNGRRVKTPHGGTFGYPVKDQKWIWTGLTEADWKAKQIPIERLPVDTDEKWRSKQFHALHVQRVRANGLPGNKEGELSCSSCHRTFAPIDRQTPRTTCGNCHNGYVEAGTSRVLIAKDLPNCISCHVQHVKDKRHWNPSLLAPAGDVAAARE